MFKQNWNKINQIKEKDYFYLTAFHYSIIKKIKPRLDRFTKGICLDIGAGNLVYKTLLDKTRYIAIDRYVTNKDLDVIADIENLPFLNNSLDTVICMQVLEHIKKPWRGLEEIYRVIKPEGYVIVSVPHIFYIHGEPEDYFRFTKYGISFLMKEAGFDVSSIEVSNGFVGFIVSFFQVILLSLCFNIPIIYTIVKRINQIITILAYRIDELFGKNGLLATNYICIGKKC
ncbi:MAG: class I SAM-dependent methyltransferase [bacterium]